jgi:small-conductance mechanosensitive channel
VLKVVATVVSNYRNYVPPHFDSDFLRGREGYFFGTYQWAFYTHIVSGPVSLVLGLFLVSEWSRTQFLKWHRYLGRVQVACVLLLVTPSGLAMAYYAAAGPCAAVGLATLAVVTAVCVSLGALAAAARRIGDHRRWMWRCFLLLCSAVVIRLIGGLASVTGMGSPWIDSLATWISWLAPLTVFEFWKRMKRRQCESNTGHRKQDHYRRPTSKLGATWPK